ncbi:YHS domain-containing (seleno)protein [Kinneretia aquatilis]|uniref:YHS domain-containing (seleno)protein n=1 Tax=Kinneretia aquatilis TaxID=2070761 RepID=UPI0014953DA8|nr:YHS domain-containing (seleno)protein [Paucibacter aquatile]WIV97286.1 YHS domain-containing (seleno)protein [Paucibacter aquatile]
MSKSYFRVSLISIAAAAALTAGLAPSAAFAYDENSAAVVNVDSKGVGLRGHDPVAYHTVGAPTAGKAEFSAKHKGVTYLFASAANRDAFNANPDKYEPAYGGFCAMGVALEKKLDGDPAAWKLVDGKLHLNVNKDVQKKWLEDVPGNNKKADANWPSIKAKTPKSLA